MLRNKQHQHLVAYDKYLVSLRGLWLVCDSVRHIWCHLSLASGMKKDEVSSMCLFSFLGLSHSSDLFREQMSEAQEPNQIMQTQLIHCVMSADISLTKISPTAKSNIHELGLYIWPALLRSLQILKSKEHGWIIL